MSKITFRADDDLVDAVEDLDESKSDVMRDALRTYLEDRDGADSIDEVVTERVDELVEGRLGPRRTPERDVNVRITVEPGEGLRSTDTQAADRARAPQRDRERPTERGRIEDRSGRTASEASGTSCAQCGESLSADHVYCPNCGEKATRRVFCECGDEVRADWAFCPHCGRRTASADALDQ